ncbi:putative bifunctional diguanylate cyclase/phosphodiesterase [Phyllobacterium zundukense]|jgi:diguanylate cyclase (GGDEF)-like protein|uniref:EAL domain-containing protein n=1 Tax=Phyllobacterium zundukense TaxID=1867719 RepID=A0ACD4D7I7_9HYPH|nr:EAL domain-containing protein [Phyllobacterium zundukense]UXN61811.1 EAL domain-containing protein [Phyllobacterium zundukense]
MSPNQPAEALALPLRHLIAADQLLAVRRSMLISVPVSIILGLISLLVALHYGQGLAGLLWFLASSLVNVVRMLLCRFPVRLLDPGGPVEPKNLDPASVRQHLFLQSLVAAASGVVWAFVAILCDGYTAPQSIFYLVVLCGITAGAITAGFAYALMPICYIVPVLLSVAGCLVYAGGFDRYCLAATTIIYLAALIRGARESEALFRQSSRLKNEATAMAISLEVARDQATQAAAKMGHRATHDELTGLLNRSGFMQEVASLPSSGEAGFALMLLDLDGFKSINDAFGHKAGDRVLVEVGRRLRQSLSNDVLVARLGGDEFAVLLDTARHDDTPSILATKLIAAISIPFATFDAGRIGVSIGVCVSSERDVDEMLVRADAALYRAKSQGRNRHYVFDDDLRDHLAMRRDIERDVAKALSNDALEVWFQPIFGNGGRKITDLEALVRWNHPRHGWIPPTDLVAVASFSGLAEPLFRYILKDVCTMMQTLRAMNLGHLRVAMNMSPREMSQLAVDDLIITKLRKLDLPASMLEIEITEDTAKDISSVQGKLAALAKEGVRIAIDDFGVGYSSMSSLRQLHVDRIKIDRSFVYGIAQSVDDRKVVQSILGLGKSLGIEVVAEGVETEADLRILRQLGCVSMQGHYFAKPMPHHEAIDWINQSRSLVQ